MQHSKYLTSFSTQKNSKFFEISTRWTHKQSNQSKQEIDRVLKDRERKLQDLENIRNENIRRNVRTGFFAGALALAITAVWFGFDFNARINHALQSNKEVKE